MRPRLAPALVAAFAACAGAGLGAISCARAESGYPYSAHRVDYDAVLAAREPSPLPAMASHDRSREGARVDFPLAGTVSHHLLASACIDEYFAELASRRAVSTFVILSPRHFPVGSAKIAFTRLDWEAGGLRVRADRALADRLRRAVGTADAAAWDPWSFHGEHGIESLIPFIAKHFPHARVVPVVLEIEGRDSEALARLGAAFAAESRRGKGVFMLVSVDFSHHEGPQVTARRDERSRAALLSLNGGNASTIYSDNPAGFHALCELTRQADRGGAEILRYATAQDFVDERSDITSYFFCFF